MQPYINQNKGFMMLKNTVIALSLLSLSATAFADGQVGAGFGSLSESFEDKDMTLSVIYASFAYKFDNSERNYFLMPEFRIAAGVDDDSINVYGRDITVEVASFVALSLRGQYNFDSGPYIYVIPSYSNFRGKITYAGQPSGDDLWEFGTGAGIGYYFNKNITAEASFEKYDDRELVSIGFKYVF
jgi:hypothetical protein